MTFEEKLQRIEQLIQVVNRSSEPLENQIAAYEEGLKLIQECRTFLKEKEQKIIDITQKLANVELQSREGD